MPSTTAATSSTDREVTDPITHLPVKIHDYTEVDLEQIPPPNVQDDEPLPDHPTNRKDEQRKVQANNKRHASLDDALLSETRIGKWVDPRDTKSRMAVHTALVAGVAAFFAALFSVILSNLYHGRMAAPARMSWLASSLASTLSLSLQILGCAVVAAVVVVVYVYAIARMPEELPAVESTVSHPREKESAPATNLDQTTWLNAVLVSLWPIINPTLFTPLADILEDSLQASLPAFVKAVKIADIGQGIEPVRIRQVQWLDATRKKNKTHKGDAEDEEEAGEYVCLELGLVYRSTLPSKGQTASIETRSSNPHMVLHIWTVAGIQIPFYISLNSLLCTLRLRVALTPNPPFTSLATITLLGAPHVSFSLTPLSRHLPNVMDVPMLSGWVKQSINAAMEMYVAPRSISLDLGLMLAGGERVDTEGVGVVVVRVISASKFRAGDRMNAWKNVVPGLHASARERQGDSYVTVGWGKWGKPLGSTRIVDDEEVPVWDEYTFLVVSPAELNSHEVLQLQLWDADRLTADDNLGNVAVDLRELMTSEDTLKRMARREDGFTDIDGSTDCPGTMIWEVGYFPKVALATWLFDMHRSGREHWQAPAKAEGSDEEDPAYAAERDIEGMDERCTNRSGHTDTANTYSLSDDEDVQSYVKRELEGKEKDFGEQAAEIIGGTPPPDRWSSGILAVRIEQIDGLEVEKIRASGSDAITTEGEEEGEKDGGEMPSAYCVVVLNHEKVFKTRTKMVTGKPYFDAGFERFIRDWRSTSVIISVRDSRLHEVNPLLGVVDLPLTRLLKHRSHITDSFPLTGGIGYGRVKLSVTFRAVEMTLAKELRGWDTGTLEVMPGVTMIRTGQVDDSDMVELLKKCRISVHTTYSKQRLVLKADEDVEAAWEAKRARSVKLAVRRRYASCVVFEFKKHALGPDLKPAFCVFWLKDIPDEEELELTLPVRYNEDDAMNRAQRTAADDISGIVEGVELKVKLRFWRGLSGYHKKIAKKDRDVANVMDVLDCAEESHGRGRDGLLGELSDTSSSSSSSSSDSDEEAGSHGVGGVVAQIKEVKRRKGKLHRRHRGLMQWSGMRKMKWAVKQTEENVGKVRDKVADKVTGKRHARKDMGMEREV
ncbi:hypothetical protein PLEOSDRAFT_1110809 [Pleurotus ostreatus PC15]|uniref:Uncharacterized protein n=1 Tax=Pleurotus ostreatus (strain PC15) TaxID=1137138 RepID=A0A067P1G8_PLEO1|nr:hypothetical protein PLEOSDRAFT_1110809 [Pleurotus ostreatus PC15]